MTMAAKINPLRGSYLRHQKPALFALGLGMAAAVWEMHRSAPPQASMTVLYLLPIGFVAWFCGSSWGYAMSAVAAAAWIHGDLSTGIVYGQWVVPLAYWNASAHFLLFLAAAALSGVIPRLRRLNEIEHEMSEVKSSMLSLVSHEFANSLTTFKLSLTILKESEGAAPSADRLLCYATLQRVYAHLSGAVANFLNLHRIEAGRYVPHIERTSLRTLIHATVGQLGPIVEEKQIHLNLDFPPRRTPVRADPDALSVVMSNLIGNAFKYTPSGGTITVRVAVDAAAEYARVSVEDTGIGIPKAELSSITSGYRRAKGGRAMAGGYGVGLKVTKELLGSQGSQLEIESEVGRGSTFSFKLPVWNEAPPKA